MQTEQEKFWAGAFGDEYITRNREGLSTSISILSKVIARTQGVDSCLEIGCNIGLNLDALRILLPQARLTGIEINEKAVGEGLQKGHDIRLGSILSADLDDQFDFVFSKGVLIHINPDALPIAYNKMYSLSRRYIMVCEYFNPSPVSIPYRGHTERLFKRDFCGELMDRFPLKLIDYGFHYRRDANFPADDVTHFLLEKV